MRRVPSDGIIYSTVFSYLNSFKGQPFALNTSISTTNRVKVKKIECNFWLNSIYLSNNFVPCDCSLFAIRYLKRYPLGPSGGHMKTC